MRLIDMLLIDMLPGTGYCLFKQACPELDIAATALMYDLTGFAFP